jgi:hypothetical protein
MGSLKEEISKIQSNVVYWSTNKENTEGLLSSDTKPKLIGSKLSFNTGTKLVYYKFHLNKNLDLPILITRYRSQMINCDDILLNREEDKMPLCYRLIYKIKLHMTLDQFIEKHEKLGYFDELLFHEGGTFLLKHHNGERDIAILKSFRNLYLEEPVYEKDFKLENGVFVY